MAYCFDRSHKCDAAASLRFLCTDANTFVRLLICECPAVLDAHFVLPCSTAPGCQGFIKFADGLGDRSHLPRMLPAAQAASAAAAAAAPAAAPPREPPTPDLRADRAGLAANAGAGVVAPHLHMPPGLPAPQARAGAGSAAGCRAAAAAAAERRAAQHGRGHVPAGQAVCTTQPGSAHAVGSAYAGGTAAEHSQAAAGPAHVETDLLNAPHAVAQAGTPARKFAPIVLDDSQDAAMPALARAGAQHRSAALGAAAIVLDDADAVPPQTTPGAQQILQGGTAWPSASQRMRARAVSSAVNDLTDSPAPVGLSDFDVSQPAASPHAHASAVPQPFAAPAGTTSGSKSDSQDAERPTVRRRLFAASQRAAGAAARTSAAAAPPEHLESCGDSPQAKSSGIATGEAGPAHAALATPQPVVAGASPSTGCSVHTPVRGDLAGVRDEAGSAARRLGRTKAERLRRTAAKRAPCASAGAAPEHSLSPAALGAAGANAPQGAVDAATGAAAKPAKLRRRAEALDLC